MIKNIKKKITLTTLVLSSLLTPLKARAQECVTDIINTNAEIGMQQAFQRSFNTKSCSTGHGYVSKFNQNLGFIQVHYDIGASAYDDDPNFRNPSITNATAIYVIGDETPLSQQVKDALAADYVFFLELSNSPSIDDARSQATLFIQQYAPNAVYVGNQNLEYKLNTSPNPFLNKLLINFTLKQKQNVKINIYDINGRNITNLLNETKEPENYSINFNNKNLNPGIYFIKFESENYKSTKKVVKVN